MSENTTKLKDDYQNSKRLNFLLISILILTILLGTASSIRLYLTPNTPITWLEISSILISVFISLVVAFILQTLRDIRLLNTINETIAEVISTNVLNEVGQIRYMRNNVLPSTLYVSKEDKLYEDQIKCFSSSQHIRFMSTSAVFLLNKAIPEIITTRTKLAIKDDFQIELLLLDPMDNRLIEGRSKQLKYFGEDKSPAILKKEILQSVMKAHQVCCQTKDFHVRIGFHKEIPFCRVELSDGVLYLSFYENQKSKDNLGPVAKYLKDKEEGTDVYQAYLQYFRAAWQKCNMQINVSDYPDNASIKGYLKEQMNEPEIIQIIDAM